jgi:hypothetical protein
MCNVFQITKIHLIKKKLKTPPPELKIASIFFPNYQKIACTLNEKKIKKNTLNKNSKKKTRIKIKIKMKSGRGGGWYIFLSY